MKLGILAVGHKLPGWVAEGCAEYVKRMPRELPLVLMAAESTRLQAALQGFRRVVVLDELGADLTTLKLAQRLEGWMREGGDTAFIIGSADGIAEGLKREADATLRLSSLTLPHAMARLIVCEQLYRAVSVLKSHPYHREG
jgi:23S rRNA (pseudouridine1915-N3)-methyltransferase